MNSPRIARIEWAPLVGERPRAAGCNATMGPHGTRVRLPIARVTLDDGSTGFGWSRIDEAGARALLGTSLDEAFLPASGVAERVLPIEYPVWDLVGRRAGAPVYRLAAAMTGVSPAETSVGRRPTNTHERRLSSEPIRVPCYDTSLYIDDLHLDDDDAAADLIASEALEGRARGHRAFKIKIGRGNLHLPTAAGFRRDVAVVRAVRAAVGLDTSIMVDANNGLTFNLARELLIETADLRLYWLEEAFYEDAMLYRRLHAWIASEGLGVLVADGENRASVDLGAPELTEGVGAPVTTPSGPSSLLMEMAREGLVDVVQYDIMAPGLTRWLQLGPLLDGWGRRSAPHHYGTLYGNYASAHLAPAVRGFAFVEWDEASTPALGAPGYRIVEGQVEVPPTPGFGLELDEDAFLRAVRADGFAVGR